MVQVEVDKPGGAWPARLGQAGVVHDVASMDTTRAVVLFDQESLPVPVSPSRLRVSGPEPAGVVFAQTVEHVHWHCYQVGYWRGEPRQPELASREWRLRTAPQTAVHAPSMLAHWVAQAVDGKGAEYALWSPSADSWLPFARADLMEVAVSCRKHAMAGGDVYMAAWTDEVRLEVCAEAVSSRACEHRADHHDLRLREEAFR